MRYWIGLVCVCGIMGICLGRAEAQKPADNPSDTFTFLHITDTHQTAGGSIEPLQKLAEEASKMAQPPAFVVDTGDITEAGRPEEYARFKEGIGKLSEAKIGFYAVPGNHDVRWCPENKACR